MELFCAVLFCTTVGPPKSHLESTELSRQLTRRLPRPAKHATSSAAAPIAAGAISSWSSPVSIDCGGAKVSPKMIGAEQTTVAEGGIF
jgi:hypothetical protein